MYKIPFVFAQQMWEWMYAVFNKTHLFPMSTWKYFSGRKYSCFSVLAHNIVFRIKIVFSVKYNLNITDFLSLWHLHNDFDNNKYYT